MTGGVRSWEAISANTRAFKKMISRYKKKVGIFMLHQICSIGSQNCIGQSHPSIRGITSFPVSIAL
jgi:hypothetical protein